MTTIPQTTASTTTTMSSVYASNTQPTGVDLTTTRTAHIVQAAIASANQRLPNLSTLPEERVQLVFEDPFDRDEFFTDHGENFIDIAKIANLGSYNTLCFTPEINHNAKHIMNELTKIFGEQNMQTMLKRT